MACSVRMAARMSRALLFSPLATTGGSVAEEGTGEAGSEAAGMLSGMTGGAGGGAEWTACRCGGPNIGSRVWPRDAFTRAVNACG